MLYDRVPRAAGSPEDASVHVTKTIRREKLAFDDAEALQALCGSNNNRLKLIERTAGVSLHLRGNEITIEGDEAATETAKTALEQLYDLALEGRPLSSDDVVRAVKLIQGDGGAATIHAVFGDTILTPRAGRPSRPASGWAFCPARSRRRSTRTSARSTTRSTTCSTPSASSASWSRTSSRSRRSHSCAAAP